MGNENADNLSPGFSIPKPGDLLANKYRIEGVMARGGHGVVFTAHQLGVERPAVVKVLPPSAGHDEGAFKRFQREARVASSLNHPNTVTIFDFGVTDGGLMFIAMEHLQGDPINVFIARNNSIEPERVRKILVQICEALVAAHAQGIIHRDLKPGNVLLCDIHGKKDWVKIIDFGIAKVLEAVDESLVQTLTQDGLTMGTPGYIAPELLAGGKATPAADIYAVGVIGYELLTGHLAFGGGTPFEKIRKQMQEEPTDPPESIKRSPLWPIIQKMYARDLATRYSSSEEALAALDSLPNLDEREAPKPREAAVPAPKAVEPAGMIADDAPTQALSTKASTSSAAAPRIVKKPQPARPAHAPHKPAPQASAVASQAESGGMSTTLIVGIAIAIFILIIAGVGGALVISAGDDAPKDSVDKPVDEAPTP